MSKNLRTILLFVGSLIVVGVILAMINIEEPQEIDVATLASRVQDEKIEKVVIRGPKLEVTMKDGSEVISRGSTELHRITRR